MQKQEHRVRTGTCGMRRTHGNTESMEDMWNAKSISHLSQPHRVTLAIMDSIATK
jgi:hypothetical protein